MRAGLAWWGVAAVIACSSASAQTRETLDEGVSRELLLKHGGGTIPLTGRGPDTLDELRDLIGTGGIKGPGGIEFPRGTPGDFNPEAVTEPDDDLTETPSIGQPSGSSSFPPPGTGSFAGTSQNAQQKSLASMTVTEPDLRLEESVRVVQPDRESAEPFYDVVAVGGRGRWHCTGVLVHPRVVLTARHCLPADRVLLGRFVHAPREERAVVSAETPQSHHLDVAVLHLDRPVASRIRELRRSAVPPGGVVRVVGFGATDARGGGTGEKRMGTLRIAGWGCTRQRELGEGCHGAFELVLPGQNGRDTCDGDSGGPLFEWTRGGWRLLGVTSRGLRSSRVSCGNGGIYTRIDQIAPWLDETIRQFTRRGDTR